MKKSILLFVFIALQTSFIIKPFNDSFERFQKMYDSDKEKCFVAAKSKVDNNTTNFVPYYFLLKIELEKYKELDYVGFIGNWSNNNDIYDNYIELMYKMIDYTNKIYDFANEDELYETNCFILFGEMNNELGNLCKALLLADKLSAKEELLKRSNSFFSIEIKDLGDGATSSRTSQDVRINNAYPNMEASKFFNGIPNGNEDIPSFNKDIELEFLRILNRARIEKGLTPLSLNQDLCRSARYHSYDMGSQNYFDHTSYDRPNNGSKLIEVCGTFTRIRKFAPCYGENIAAGNGSAEGVYNQWFNSPGHKKNMFNSSWTKIGIGFVRVPGSKFIDYWTTDFY